MNELERLNSILERVGKLTRLTNQLKDLTDIRRVKGIYQVSRNMAQEKMEELQAGGFTEEDKKLQEAKEAIRNAEEYIRQAEEYEQILSELPKNELHFAKSRYTVMRNEDQARYEELLAEGYTKGDQELKEVMQRIRRYDTILKRLNTLKAIFPEDYKVDPIPKSEQKEDIDNKSKEQKEKEKDEHKEPGKETQTEENEKKNGEPIVISADDPIPEGFGNNPIVPNPKFGDNPIVPVNNDATKEEDLPKNPNPITKIKMDNGEGTYTVFYKNGQSEEYQFDAHSQFKDRKTAYTMETKRKLYKEEYKNREVKVEILDQVFPGIMADYKLAKKINRTPEEEARLAAANQKVDKYAGLDPHLMDILTEDPQALEQYRVAFVNKNKKLMPFKLEYDMRKTNKTVGYTRKEKKLMKEMVKANEPVADVKWNRRDRFKNWCKKHWKGLSIALLGTGIAATAIGTSQCDKPTPQFTGNQKQEEPVKENENPNPEPPNNRQDFVDKLQDGIEVDVKPGTTGYYTSEHDSPEMQFTGEEKLTVGNKVAVNKATGETISWDEYLNRMATGGAIEGFEIQVNVVDENSQDTTKYETGTGWVSENDIEIEK